MKKLYTLLCLCLCGAQAWAYDFTTGGLFYNINPDGTTVDVAPEIPSSIIPNFTTTSVTIPSSVTDPAEGGKTYNVTGIADGTFKMWMTLQSVEIPASVTKIGKDAFNLCVNLETVTIKTPSALTTIDDNAFWVCKKLSSITIPETVTSIGDQAFLGCNSLGTSTYTVTIPAATTHIGSRAFSECYGLTAINVASDNPNYCSEDGVLFNKGKTTLITFPKEKVGIYTIPDGINSIELYAFFNCEKLTQINFPASGVKSIGEYGFANCFGLTTLTVPSGVSSIGEKAFDQIKSVKYEGTAEGSPWGALTVNTDAENGFIYADNTKTIIKAYIGDGGDITIPGSVKEIADMAFYNCGNITSITIPSNTVRGIGDNAFARCSALTEVEINEGLFTIGDYAFQDCGNLTNIRIPSSLTHLGKSAFSGCDNLNYEDDFDDLSYLGNGDNAFVVLAKVDKNVETCGLRNICKFIYSGAFDYCTNLTSITLSDELIQIGEEAFCGCTSLTTISIPGKVANIGDRAFVSCKGLTSVTLPANLASIGTSAFADCTGLTTVEVPTNVTSVGDNAFSGVLNIAYDGSLAGCPWGAKALNAVFDTDGFVYADNTKETLVGYIGSSDAITIPASVVTIGESAFKGLTNITSLSFAGSNITTIEQYAFQGCTGLTSVSIPSSVTSINYSAFEGCNNIQTLTFDTDAIGSAFSDKTNLTTVNIGSNVASIPTFAFSGCTALASITIPANITTIGLMAFQGCSALESIEIPATVTSFGNFAFMNCSSLTSATIKSASVSSYAFMNCNALNNVSLVGVKIIYDLAFCECTSLSEITIPATVTEIYANILKGCTSLTTITVEEGNTTYFAADGVLYGHHTENGQELTTLEFCSPGRVSNILAIPDDVDKIFGYAFDNCNNLEYIAIPKSVKYIFDISIQDCDNVTFLCEISQDQNQWPDYQYDNQWNHGCQVVWGCQIVHATPNNATYGSVEDQNAIIYADGQFWYGPNDNHSITAVAKDGYEFVSWETKGQTVSEDMVLTGMNTDDWYVARFKPANATAITSADAEVVKIYARGSNIVVDNATDDVFVYDATGRQISHQTPMSQNVISVGSRGLYFVKCDNVSEKVIIK